MKLQSDESFASLDNGGKISQLMHFSTCIFESANLVYLTSYGLVISFVSIYTLITLYSFYNILISNQSVLEAAGA